MSHLKPFYIHFGHSLEHQALQGITKQEKEEQEEKSNKMIIMGHIISLGVMRGKCHNSHQRKFSKRESSGYGKHYETEKSFATLQPREGNFNSANSNPNTWWESKTQHKHAKKIYKFNGENGCHAILNITFLLLKVHWRTICRVKSRPPRDWGWDLLWERR